MTKASRLSKAQEAIRDLNEIVGRLDSKSVLCGLVNLSLVFGLLLDTYARPNPNNPEGMCDSPKDFRKMFARIIETGVVPDELAPKKGGCK